MKVSNNTQLLTAERYVRETNVSIFLTGRAGTGKTTFLRHIVDTINKRCVVLAPTGVAAVNSSGVTIHSFFQLPLCPYLPDVKELVTEYQMPDKFNRLRKEKIKVIRTLELIIIDEISMVRADLLDAVDMTLRRYRRNSKPFGGVQLLMIGDVQQLPPVVTEEERPFLEKVYPSSFFFHSKALQRTNFVTIELTHIFRQKDADFITLLNNIRDNRADAETLKRLNARHIPGFDPPEEEHYIRLTTHNYQSNRVNQQKLQALKGQPFTLSGSVEGNFPESSFPTDKVLTLKKGAQVMFVKNDSSGHEYYNGKIATVEGYDPDEGVAVVDREGNHTVVKREKWENIRYETDPDDNQIKQKVDGTFEQFPLRLAWAITVHKSQGLTFDKVIIDAASAFSYGQVYVALSRCRSLEGVVLATPISAHCIFDNHDVIEFKNTFPSIDKVEHDIAPLSAAYFYDLLHELFDFGVLFRSGERLNTLFQQHLRRSAHQAGDRMNETLNGGIVNLVNVGEKFRQQLSRIRMQYGDRTDDPFIAERIHKAVVYFGDELEKILLRLAPVVEVKPTNPTVAADFNESSSELLDNISLKQLCLKRVAEKGFTTATYNNAKSDFILNKEKSPKPKAKRRKPRK